MSLKFRVAFTQCWSFARALPGAVWHGLRYWLVAMGLCSCAAPLAEPTGEASDAAMACDCSALPTTPCSRPACDEHGVCYLDHTDDGDPADMDQPHGDCMTAVCVGLAVVQTFEPHDPPMLPDHCLVAWCTPVGVAWIERDGCYP